MDFGLAKQASAPWAAVSTELTMEQSKLTAEGMIVGTSNTWPQSSWKARRRMRAPIFSRSGRSSTRWRQPNRRLTGESRASLIAAILTSEPPPMTQLQPTTPPALERVVSKCLAKDPDERWQNAGDLAIELNWAAESGLQAAMEVANRKNSLVWMVLSLVLMAAFATLTVFHFRRSPAPATVVRFSFAPPEKTSIGDGDGVFSRRQHTRIRRHQPGWEGSDLVKAAAV